MGKKKISINPSLKIVALCFLGAAASFLGIASPLSSNIYGFNVLGISLVLAFNVFFWLTIINASKLAQLYLGNKPWGIFLRIIFTAVFVISFILSILYIAKKIILQSNLDGGF